MIHERIIQQFIQEKRPPEEIRDKLDLGYSFENQVLIIFEIRPNWMNKKEKIQSPFAKSRFIKSRGIWKIYWRRASGKWELYAPNPEVKNISKVLQIIDEDAYGCFKG